MSKVYIASSPEEACAYLKDHKCIPCAGATNLYVDRYLGKFLDKDMVSLHKLDQLKIIRYENHCWHIGSLVTFDQLESYFKEIKCMSALAKAASLVGGPQVRNRGTIGGNIVSASPSADSLPVLMALDASLLLQSVDGYREVSIKDFMVGVKKTAIEDHELLTEIIIPEHDGDALFRKVGKRNALAISICNVSVYAHVSQGVLKEVAIAIGSCAPTCVRAHETEMALLGMKTPERKEEWQKVRACIEENLGTSICPIDDVRATASYRRKVAGNLVYQLLKELWEA